MSKIDCFEQLSDDEEWINVKNTYKEWTQPGSKETWLNEGDKNTHFFSYPYINQEEK